MRNITIATFLLLLITVACSRDAEDTLEPTMSPAPTPPAPIATPPPVTSTRIVVEGGQGVVGDVIPVEIALYDAVAGVSGYAIQVSSANPQVARIKDVRLPDYGLTKVGELPADSVDITIVDLPSLLEGAFTRETLATLDMELLSPGQAQILLELHLLDDDTGNVLAPEVVSGIVQVD
jgi:hypothetical protein